MTGGGVAAGSDKISISKVSIGASGFADTLDPQPRIDQIATTVRLDQRRDAETRPTRICLMPFVESA